MSKNYVAPYVNLQGRAREAIEFYRDVLGGTVKVDEEDGRVSLAQLDAEGIVLFATDGHPKFGPTVGDNMAIVLGGSDKDRLTEAFQALSEGGRVKGPLSRHGGGP
ncbi:MAG TPA: VOC family protein, partial [Candidatus Dormibacteraeota bacterium]|nr:VOC family protein [Candidatus Dormibacteraeota bacterium]